jgi:KDO2-lipid IV(A) lauroyltransferase
MAAGTAEVVAAGMARTMGGRREMARRHQRRVRPELKGWALERAVDRVFASYGRYWYESFRLPRLSPADLDAAMSYEGLERLDEALAAGRGAVLALPHLGGWDFGGAWLASLGYRLTVVVEPLEPAEMFEWFVAFRRSLGVTVVPLGPEAGTAVLGTLRANESVALISDRDLVGNGVEVEFFGERTTLPAGPATLALRNRAALLPAAVYLRPGGGHHGVMRPPMAVERSGAGLREDVRRITQDLAHVLEDLIRQAPEQWHLFQPNWPSDRLAST